MITKTRGWWAVLLAVTSTLAWAGGGAGELSLDRGAVGAIVSAALPAPVKIGVAGLGSVSLQFAPPRRVEFSAGGVDVVLAVTVLPLQLAGDVNLRFLPVIDEQTGTVSFRAQSASASGPLAILPDLAPFFPPIALPRQFELALVSADDPSRMILSVQGVSVEADRLVVRLGLNSRGRAR
jgi:hypothetical protein